MSDAPKLELVKSDHSEMRGKMHRRFQCCGNCSAFMSTPGAAGATNYNCHANPPVLNMAQVMGGSPLDPGGMRPAMQLMGNWPPTKRNLWCRQWGPIEDDAKAAD